jgi:hypothetical protein
MMLDPMANFIKNVRTQCSGALVLVGPVCSAGPRRRLIEIVAAARWPISEHPFASLVWEFTVPEPPKTDDALIKWRAEWGHKSFWLRCCSVSLKLLRHSVINLILSVPPRSFGPCSWTAEGRERIEADQQRRTDWERRRVAYIVKREREGIKGDRAHIEFLNKVRPT